MGARENRGKGREIGKGMEGRREKGWKQERNANDMASDRMRKKIKDYAEIFGHIMRKHALIMRKLHRIMRKFKQVIKLIIRPVQLKYMEESPICDQLSPLK